MRDHSFLRPVMIRVTLFLCISTPPLMFEGRSASSSGSPTTATVAGSPGWQYLEEVFRLAELDFGRKDDELTSRCLEMFERCGNDYGAASDAVDLACRAYGRRGEFEKARELRRAMRDRFKGDDRFHEQCGEKVSDVSEESYLNAMALLETKAHNYPQAITYWREYLSFLRTKRDDPISRWPQWRKQNRDREILSGHSWDVGLCYYRLGRYKEAAEQLRNHESFVRKYGLYAPWDETRKSPEPELEFRFYVELYLMLGECHLKLGDNEQARAAFESAKRNLERSDVMHARPWTKEFSDRAREMGERTLPEWIEKCRRDGAAAPRGGIGF